MGNLEMNNLPHVDFTLQQMWSIRLTHSLHNEPIKLY